MSFTKRAFMAAPFLMLSACHGYVAPQRLAENCPYTHKFFDLTFCWKIERSAGRFTIPGYVTNTRFSNITDLELTASLLDERERTIGEGTSFLIPPLIAMDETASFTLIVPVRLDEKPAKIKILYRYRLADREDQTTYFNSFVTDLR